jgi:hypothetical protein
MFEGRRRPRVFPASTALISASGNLTSRLRDGSLVAGEIRSTGRARHRLSNDIRPGPEATGRTGPPFGFTQFQGSQAPSAADRAGENLETGFAVLPKGKRRVPGIVFELFRVLATVLGRRGGDLFLSPGPAPRDAFRGRLAGGKVVRVDETTDPEPFWGMRGDGASFGIVTEFVVRLREMPNHGIIHGAPILCPADKAREVMTSWLARIAKHDRRDQETLRSRSCTPPTVHRCAESSR